MIAHSRTFPARAVKGSRARGVGELRAAVFETGWGWMSALVSARGLRRLSLPQRTEQEAWDALADASLASTDEPLARDLSSRLDRYFSGLELDWALPLEVVGTPFQQAVWRETSAILRGQTRTYRELAFTLGIPAGARAVGGALRANPIPIVVPCHRVVGSNGGLVGYAGLTGVELKARLLRLEGASW
jgi:methylated-DNA-[protein]-cysteine S-methyltransferase